MPTTSGGSVPLKVVAEIGFGAGPTIIQRYNQIRRISIGADLAPGVVTGDALTKVDALPRSTEPAARASKKLSVGDSQVAGGADGQLPHRRGLRASCSSSRCWCCSTGGCCRRSSTWARCCSRRWAARWRLHISGNAVSMPVFIGILMLLGIVAKNSILLIDFAIEEMDKGVEKNEAIIDAGHKRAQPIVMTTVAMVAGMMPTALSLTGDGSWRAPMGVTVIGGLILSTMLTLVIVPGRASASRSTVEKWLGRRFGRLVTYPTGDERRSRSPRVRQPAE